MNTDNAHPRILAALSATAECVGYPLSQAACQAMLSELIAYPPEHVLHALRDCMRTLQSRLTLAAILQRIQAQDGHPSANEAWAIALEATDEYKSVSLTPQIQQALATAQPVLAAGDKIGARMAFLAAYERLLTQAREQKQPATWTLSIGFDVDNRRAALEAAKTAGRLTYQPDPLLALPPPQTDANESKNHPGRAAVLELLAEWKREEEQAKIEKRKQRQRDLEQLEQRRAHLKAQWEQKHGPLATKKQNKTKSHEAILENEKEAAQWIALS